MTFTVVELTFKGNETIDELYALQYKELKQTITAVMLHSPEKVNDLKLELMEYIAEIDYMQSKARTRSC